MGTIRKGYFVEFQRNANLVLCLARLQAVSQAKPGQNRPGPAGPNCILVLYTVLISVDVFETLHSYMGNITIWSPQWSSYFPIILSGTFQPDTFDFGPVPTCLLSQPDSVICRGAVLSSPNPTVLSVVVPFSPLPTRQCFPYVVHFTWSPFAHNGTTNFVVLPSFSKPSFYAIGPVFDTMRKLAKRGAIKASVRPTGWHGESGLATAGGHIVVDWYRLDGTHVSTHQVYPTDNAYPVLCIYPPQNSLVLHALPLADPKSICKTAFGLATPKPLLNSGGSGWRTFGKIDTEAVP
ncbi:hypothetical protein BYT27DRAFT_7210704 [Phlegmacium glaucopus]|nr:hypothetical protein BYT27DRAFT_7210704 [Phlegmacium glaucopus]